MVKDLGWEGFVRERREQGDFMDLGGLEHPARRLLMQYQNMGYPVVLLGKKWMEGQRRPALDRGTHKSTLAHIPFLREYFS